MIIPCACTNCGRQHGFIGVVDCGHSFCEECVDNPNCFDMCLPCEMGEPALIDRNAERSIHQT